MKLIFFSFITLIFISLYNPGWVDAVYDPRLLANNIFGIHIVDANDIPDAALLVNQGNNQNVSWGYVTFVITEDERDVDKWTEIFNSLSYHQLIPIVRIATRVENGVWIQPKMETIAKWSEFLDSLPWPIKNRYVILYNEPNHAKEWGRVIDPHGYALFSAEFIKKLKEKSDDFFVLPAALDLYAGNGPSTMEATSFWQLMESAQPGILSRFDGLASHSYPADDFTATPYDTGRKSIQGYNWEIDYLSQNFGVDNNLPVFITETGWDRDRLSPEIVAFYYKIAFEEFWLKDPQIVAVTPFLLNYQDGLFGRFSFRKFSSDEYYPQYYQIQALDKISGQPLIIPKSKFGYLLAKDL